MSLDKFFTRTNGKRVLVGAGFILVLFLFIVACSSQTSDVPNDPPAAEVPAAQTPAKAETADSEEVEITGTPVPQSTPSAVEHPNAPLTPSPEAVNVDEGEETVYPVTISDDQEVTFFQGEEIAVVFYTQETGMFQIFDGDSTDPKAVDIDVDGQITTVYLLSTNDWQASDQVIWDCALSSASNPDTFLTCLNTPVEAADADAEAVDDSNEGEVAVQCYLPDGSGEEAARADVFIRSGGTVDIITNGNIVTHFYTTDEVTFKVQQEYLNQNDGCYYVVATFEGSGPISFYVEAGDMILWNHDIFLPNKN